MKKSLVVLSTFLVLLLIGCATPYQPNGLTGGFSESRLGENVFQVSFRGNGYTNRERVIDFTLLRSAELTLQNGYRYFVIVNSNNFTRYGTYTTPARYTGNVDAWGDVTLHQHGGQTYFFQKPTHMNTIICYRKKPRTQGLVYDANFIVNTIRAKYNIEAQK